MSTITKLEVNLSERYIPPEPTPEEPEEGSEEWCKDHLEDPRCEQYRPIDPVDPTPEEPEEGSEEWCKTHQDSELCKEKEEDNEETGDAPDTGHHTILSVGDNNNTPTSTPFIVASATIALLVLVACFVKFFKHKKEDKNHYYLKQQKGYRKAYATILPVLSLALIAGIFARVFAYNYENYPDLTASKILTIDDADIIGTDEIRYVKDTLVLPKSNYGYKLYIYSDNNKLTSYNQGIYLNPVASTGALTENTFGYSFSDPTLVVNQFRPLDQTENKTIIKDYDSSVTKDGITLDIWWGINAKSAEEGNYELDINYELHEQTEIKTLDEITPEICASIPVGSFINFIDARNNQTYVVYKDTFGRCNNEGMLTHDEGGNPTIEPISRDQFPDLDPEESICPTGWHEVITSNPEAAEETTGCVANYTEINYSVVIGYDETGDPIIGNYDQNGNPIDDPTPLIPADDEDGNNYTITVKAPAQPEGAEPGQEFYGWSTDLDAETGEYQPGEEIVIDSPDFVLYPIWEKKTPKAILDTNRRLNFVYDYYSVEDAKNNVDNYKTNYINSLEEGAGISTTSRYNSETYSSYDDDDIYGVPANSTTQSDLGWNSKDVGHDGYYGYISCGVFDVNFEDSFRDFKPTSLRSWFQGGANIASFSNMDNLDVSEVTDMNKTFFQMINPNQYCASKGKPVNDRKLQIESGELVSTIDLSSWNVSNAKTADYLFAETELYINIDGWASKTSSITSMYNMFFKQKLTKKNVEEIEKFDTSSTTTLFGIFGSATLVDESENYAPIDFELDLSTKEISEDGKTWVAWDTKNVTSFGSMFASANSQDNFFVDTTGWDTTKAKSFYSMFSKTYAANTWEVVGLDKFDTNSVSSGSTSGLGMMFEHAGAPNSDFTYDLSGWKGNANNAFYGFVANKFSPNLSNWELAPYYDYQWYDGWAGIFNGMAVETFAPNLSGWNIDSERSSAPSTEIFSYIKAREKFAPIMDDWQLGNVDIYCLFRAIHTKHFAPDFDITITQSLLNKPFELVKSETFEPTGTISTTNENGITSIDYLFQSVAAVNFRPDFTINNFTDDTTAKYMYKSAGCQTTESDIVPITEEMCQNATFSALDTSNLKNMSYMFADAQYIKSLSLPSGFGQSATNMSRMFSIASLTSLTLPEGFGSRATDMSGMFNDASSLTSLTLPSGFGQAATSMSYMFVRASSLTSLTLPSGFGQNATDMRSMFYGASLTSVKFPAGFGQNATDMRSMFSYASRTSLTLPAGFGQSATDMRSMFYGASLTSVKFPAGFGQSATNMSSMFYSASHLTSLTLPSGFGQSATNMSSMFYSASHLTSVKFPAGFGQSATNMSQMFFYARSLTSLTFPAGFGQSATNMNAMFDSASSLKNIYVPAGTNWATKTPAVTSSLSMFRGASKLPNYNNSRTNISAAHIGDVDGIMGYFTDVCEKDNSCGEVQGQQGQQSEQPPLMSYTPISEQSTEESTEPEETPVSTGEEKKSTKKSDTKSEQTEPLGVKKSVEKASTVDTATIAVIVASFVLVSAGAVIIFLIEKRRNEDEE